MLRVEGGRGGSAFIHDRLAPGSLIRVRGPKNHFRLDEGFVRYLLIAGGIGITPILAMADRLARLGKDYAIHYVGRSRASMAFVGRLERDHGARLRVYSSRDGQRPDLAALVAASDAEIYACGPERLLDALDGLTRERPERLHVEHFSPPRPGAGGDEAAFSAELRDAGLTVQVAPRQTLLQALRAAGIDVPSDCEEGLCGTCEVEVVAGGIDHRDRVLSASERASETRMMACCSRARDGRLVLAL